MALGATGAEWRSVSRVAGLPFPSSRRPPQFPNSPVVVALCRLCPTGMIFGNGEHLNFPPLELHVHPPNGAPRVPRFFFFPLSGSRPGIKSTALPGGK